MQRWVEVEIRELDMTDRLLRRSKDFWCGKRVIVTGGAGFLGSFVVEGLQQSGAGEIIAPRSASYDLRQKEAILALLRDSANPKPVDMIIHLAARVGGIGANRAHPAEFFGDNLMMGAQLLHESWRAGVDKFVAIGTVCAYPKYTPVPFHQADLWKRLPRRDKRPLWSGKKCFWCRARRIVSTIRLQLHFPFAHQSLRPWGQL